VRVDWSLAPQPASGNGAVDILSCRRSRTGQPQM